MLHAISDTPKHYGNFGKGYAIRVSCVDFFSTSVMFYL